MSLDWMRGCLNRLENTNLLDVGKLGVFTKRLKIALQLGSIQFYLHVLLMLGGSFPLILMHMCALDLFIGGLFTLLNRL